MTRFVVLAIAGCIASAALSAPAYADPILPDPTAGVRGADTGSPPVTDGSAFALAACLIGEGDVAAFCAPFNFSGEEGVGENISSFALAFWDATGAPIAYTTDDGELTNFFASAQSIFHGIEVFSTEGHPADGHTIRLFAIQSLPGCEFDCFDDSLISPQDLLIFAEDTFDFHGGFVSIQAVNEILNTNRADPTKSVPEPATIFLMGSGLVGIVARERLRRRGRAA